MTSIVLNSPINPQQLPEVLAQLVRTARRRAHIVINLTPLSSTQNTQVNNVGGINSLSAEMLRPYIDLGLLDEQMMPMDNISNGQKSMIAHDIAVRLKIQNFWPIFEQMWGINNMRTYYTRFCKSQKSIEFMRLLSRIK